jgi:hypothetical protein
MEALTRRQVEKQVYRLQDLYMHMPAPDAHAPAPTTTTPDAGPDAATHAPAPTTGKRDGDGVRKHVQMLQFLDALRLHCS